MIRVGRYNGGMVMNDARGPSLKTFLFGNDSFIRKTLQALVAHLAARAWSRDLLNSVYNLLGSRARRRVYLLFAKIFRDRNIAVEGGTWRLRNMGQEILITLRSDSMWLDWDSALALLGNDLEVKQTYFNIMESNLRPEIFCDIGANYGSHSLLFLTRGIQTISFEPNRVCVDRFKELCAANHVTPVIHQCALGDQESAIDLVFSPRDTWAGTTLESERSTDVPEGWSKISVPLHTFDRFLPDLVGKKMLVKIDAEGAEDRILRGAKAVIAACRPIILFECWEDPDFRQPLIDAFQGYDYSIGELPWAPGSGFKRLTDSEFIHSKATNFIGAPNEHLAVP